MDDFSGRNRSRSLFLAQALSEDRSCQHAVNEWFVSRQVAGFSPISTNTAAYCCARQRLPAQLIRELVRYSGHELQQRAVRPWKWKGRCVKMVDGTTLSMPDTEENQAKYPQPKTQQPGVGLAWGRLGEVDNQASLIALLTAMTQKRVGNRPGRIEPRQRKRRPKPFPPLKKPRDIARKIVIRHGHESKLAA